MSQETYDELLRAGAPALPDGYFYRISRDSMGGFYNVDIRKRGRFLSVSVLGGSRPFIPDDTISPERFFALSCRHVFEGWQEFKADIEASVRAERFLGDHP